MGESTAIEWCDHTANFWIGCERVSPGCDHCYAEKGSRRLGAQHGLSLWDGDRYVTRTTVESVRTWNRRAERDGVRRRVFAMSHGDVFEDREDLDEVRMTVVWPLVEECRALDFLLLTKRPENIPEKVPRRWLDRPLPNVWLGVTAENEQRARGRIPLLLDVPAEIHFVSYEPGARARRLLAVPPAPRLGHRRRRERAEGARLRSWVGAKRGLAVSAGRGRVFRQAVGIGSHRRLGRVLAGLEASQGRRSERVARGASGEGVSTMNRHDRRAEASRARKATGDEVANRPWRPIDTAPEDLHCAQCHRPGDGYKAFDPPDGTASYARLPAGWLFRMLVSDAPDGCGIEAAILTIFCSEACVSDWTREHPAQLVSHGQGGSA